MNQIKDKKKKPIRAGRIIGYSLLILGGISIVDFFSPIPIPTVGASAIITGLLFIAAGVFALIPDKRALGSKIRTLLTARSQPALSIDPLIPVRILELARDNQGVLTVSAVAVGLNIPLETAEAGLNACVRGGQATADFDMQREIKTYSFPEFLTPPGEEPEDG